MTRKKLSKKRHKDKPKKIGGLFNKVFDDFKKKQKNNEKKEIKTDGIKVNNEK